MSEELDANGIKAARAVFYDVWGYSPDDILIKAIDAYLSTRSTPTGEVEADQVKHMVDRFLSWRLPESFNPDGGISFERDYNQSTPWPAKHEPTGTNLFDAQQAEAMVRYMLEGTALVTSVFPSEQTDVSAMPSHTAADAVHAVFSDMLHGRIPTPSAAQLIQVLGPEPFHAVLSAPKPVVEGWRDIKTAPEGTDPMLLYCGFGKLQEPFVVVGRRHMGGYPCWVDAYEGEDLADPTHWQLLPEPPASAPQPPEDGK